MVEIKVGEKYKVFFREHSSGLKSGEVYEVTAVEKNLVRFKDSAYVFLLHTLRMEKINDN